MLQQTFVRLYYIDEFLTEAVREQHKSLEISLVFLEVLAEGVDRLTAGSQQVDGIVVSLPLLVCEIVRNIDVEQGQLQCRKHTEDNGLRRTV